MKKLLLLPLIALSLVACGEGEITTPVISKEDQKIFFSEVYAPMDNLFAKAIEIANVNDNTVDISGYTIKVYSGKQLVSEITLKNANISSNDVYVIGTKTNDSRNYHQECDLILDDDVLTGSNLIKLFNKDGNLIDVLGSKYGFDYAVDTAFLKFPEVYNSNIEFNQLDYVKVNVDKDYHYLGNLDFIEGLDKKTLLDGPRITEEMYALPYQLESGKPGGGFAKVRVVGLGDGDTTNFEFEDNYVGIESRERTRYMFINTPEIYHPAFGNRNEIEEQPWGVAAQKYNNNLLRNAKSVLLQSSLGGSFRETYGRLLGFVWYATTANPKLSDYRLLNYEMVREAYAYFGDSQSLRDMTSNGIRLHTYFEYAYYRAQKLGIKIHGEKDPNFNYKEN